jgi:CBS domain containing-hemolysin-like protein
MIDSVLEFGETIVREVMTPRPDMVTVPVTAKVDELISVTMEEGFSRIPVTSNGDIVGMVIVKDLLPMLIEGRRPASVAEVMRPVEFIPETKLASALLGEMQASRLHQMIVVDEYGEVAGLVTIEDLLEELVGEITDETDEDETFISPRADGGWDVDARLSVDDLAEAAGVDLPDEDWDTVGGLVLGLAERVPDEGERFSYGPLTLTVTRMQGRRVGDVLVSVSEDGVRG